MGFLLSEIAILLLLAAALGFALAHWWIRRRFEDVTLEWPELAAGRMALPAALEAKALAEGGREALLRQLEEQAAWRTTVEMNLDLGPVMERLIALEEQLRPADLSSLDERLRALERAVGAIPESDGSAIAWRLEELGEAIREEQPAHRALEGQLGTMASAIAALRTPDLDPLERRLGELEASIRAIQASGFSALEGQLRTLADAVAATRSSGLGPIETRLAALESRAGPVNLDPLSERLGSVERAVVDIAATNLVGIEQRLVELDRAVRSNHPENLCALEERLGKVAESVAALRGPDLGSVEARLASVERRLEPLDPSPLGAPLEALERAVRALSAPDLAPIEKRLSGIEATVEALRPTPLSALAASAKLPTIDLAPLGAFLEAVERESSTVSPLETHLERLDDSAPRPDGARPVPNGKAMDIAVRAAACRAPGANLLDGPRHGRPDDLTVIKGLDAEAQNLLNELGVFYYWQMAEWREADTSHVDSCLNVFKGRIVGDHWVEQARRLAQIPDAARKPQRVEQARPREELDNR